VDVAVLGPNEHLGARHHAPEERAARLPGVAVGVVGGVVMVRIAAREGAGVDFDAALRARRAVAEDAVDAVIVVLVRCRSESTVGRTPRIVAMTEFRAQLQAGAPAEHEVAVADERVVEEIVVRAVPEATIGKAKRGVEIVWTGLGLGANIGAHHREGGRFGVAVSPEQVVVVALREVDAREHSGPTGTRRRRLRGTAPRSKSAQRRPCRE
jgi:hypothetical protein